MDEMPTSIITAYSLSVEDSVPWCVLMFTMEPDKVSASEMVGAMDWIANNASDFRKFRDWYASMSRGLFVGEHNGEGAFYNYLHDELTGQRLPGMFHFSDHFIDTLSGDRLAHLISDFGGQKVALSGSADTLGELSEHVQFLKSSDFAGQDVVMRVERSDDFELFRSLYHVGQWGTDLRSSSAYAEMGEFAKLDMSDSKRPDSFAKRHKGWVESKFKDVESDWRDSVFWSDVHGYNQAYVDYEASHDGFFKFEIWSLARAEKYRWIKSDYL